MPGKLKTIEQLGELAAAARAGGLRVVLAHGVFDILHVGHKRHLDIGKRSGDVLIVTITTDRYVSKGPGRPVFTEKLRAEMLSALESVDYVGISPDPGAEFVIEKIRPHVYLKGSEYSVDEKDVTGRIAAERAAVEKFGGQVVFTEDITFSSSSLANRALQIYPEEAQAYLGELRGRMKADDLIGQLRATDHKRCLVLGDTILDEYVYVEPLGKPSKENIIATKYREREIFCGGVIATANMVAQFCDRVDLATLLGQAESHEKFIRHSIGQNINLIPFFRSDAKTTIKSRLVDPAYLNKLIEIAHLSDTPLPEPEQKLLNSWIDGHIGGYDFVVVNDFGHGMIDEELIEILCAKARFLAVNAQTNSANRGFNLITKYRRADLICIDEPEARLAVSDRYSPMEVVLRNKLGKRIDCPYFVITHGKLGCLISAPGHDTERIPALTDEAIDTIGAGDAFFAATAALTASGCDPFVAAFIGNAVGAMKIRIVGHRHQITRAEVIKYLSSLLK